jgi:HK97 gp10 family phage protein
MAKVKAEWKNREGVMNELARVAPAISVALADAQLKVAKDLAKRVKTYAPVNTGTYRDSIIGEKLSDHPDKKLVGAVSAPKDPNATGLFASYLWRWLEFGTVKMKARPHIFPVYRARKPYMLRKLRLTVNNAVKAFKRGNAGSVTGGGGGGGSDI